MRGIQWLQSHQIQPSRFRNTKKAESPLQPVTGTMPPSKCCPWLAHSRSFDFLTVTLRSSCTAFCDNRFVLPENFGLKQTDLILFRFKYVIYCFLRVCVCVCVCVCFFFNSTTEQLLPLSSSFLMEMFLEKHYWILWHHHPNPIVNPRPCMAVGGNGAQRGAFHPRYLRNWWTDLQNSNGDQ